MVNKACYENKLGVRYYFQSQRCRRQWRHSRLVNYLNRTATGYQVRVEGSRIG